MVCVVRTRVFVIIIRHQCNDFLNFWRDNNSRSRRIGMLGMTAASDWPGRYFCGAGVGFTLSRNIWSKGSEPTSVVIAIVHHCLFFCAIQIVFRKPHFYFTLIQLLPFCPTVLTCGLHISKNGSSVARHHYRGERPEASFRSHRDDSRKLIL